MIFVTTFYEMVCNLITDRIQAPSKIICHPKNPLSPGNNLFALSVGATDPRDRTAGFSGGRTQIIRESDFIDESELPLAYSKPDLSAPGVAIFSSVPGDGWKAFNGTSMATPHVAGAIALLPECGLSLGCSKFGVVGVIYGF